MPARFGDLKRLSAIMSALGASRLIAKRLAANDNSKNGIYLAGNVGALNILPSGEFRDESSAANQILKAPLNFQWLEPDGSVRRAPGAQLILYPQYPEVRMSGFLARANSSASELMSLRSPGRALFLAIGGERLITGAVVSPDDMLAIEFESIVAGREDRVFHEFDLGSPDADPKAQLLRELERIHGLGWIDSKRLLGDGNTAPCNAQNCGGYTLEAELGVRPNGFSEPDFRGWEVKQYGVSDFEKLTGAGPITLMTPEPTGGVYRDLGVRAFLDRYGYADRRGRADRRNFGGVYRVGKRVDLTGLTLVLDGYDAVSSRFVDATRGVTLIDDQEKIAAAWSYVSLIEHWKRKHAQAVYVPSMGRLEPSRQYRYGETVTLGEGTDIIRFLNLMASGHVYYDPAVKMEAASAPKPSIKRRSQFRIRASLIGELYAASERFRLSR